MTETRFALVRNARDARQLWAYLPDNYAIVGGDIGEPGSPVYLIAGKDVAGWTLDDYVIPRLASGLIWADEIADIVQAIRDQQNTDADGGAAEPFGRAQ